jgi:hypothetical protein
MSRFDSLDRLLAHDDNFRELLTILTGDTSGHDHLNGTSAANMPFAGGSSDDVAGEAGSGNNQIAEPAYGAEISAEQNDHFSVLHMIESMHRLPALGQSASAPVPSFASTSRESSTGETHVTSPPTVTVSPPVTGPVPADPTLATPTTLSADFATSNLDAGPYWAMNSTWNVVQGRARSAAPMAGSLRPRRPATPRNMRQWINTLPQRHFTDANGRQWTVAENNSVNPPVVMFVPSKFLVTGQHRD